MSDGFKCIILPVHPRFHAQPCDNTGLHELNSVTFIQFLVDRNASVDFLETIGMLEVPS